MRPKTKNKININKLKAKSSQLKAFNIDDIELIKLTIKGKDHLLIPKPGHESEAEITKRSGILLFLDHYLVMDPSIQEINNILKGIMD